MSMKYREESITQSRRNDSRERKNLEEIRDGFEKVIDRLNTKVKKPLRNLRVMIEAEIDRLKSQEWLRTLSSFISYQWFSTESRGWVFENLNLQHTAKSIHRVPVSQSSPLLSFLPVITNKIWTSKKTNSSYSHKWKKSATFASSKKPIPS